MTTVGATAWEPRPHDRFAQIVMVGDFGTKDTGWVVRGRDGAWALHTGAQGEVGVIRPAVGPARWAAYEPHVIRRGLHLAYQGDHFMEAVRAVLGRPGRGYRWYEAVTGAGEPERR